MKIIDNLDEVYDLEKYKISASIEHGILITFQQSKHEIGMQFSLKSFEDALVNSYRHPHEKNMIDHTFFIDGELDPTFQLIHTVSRGNLEINYKGIKRNFDIRSSMRFSNELQKELIKAKHQGIDLNTYPRLALN